MRSRWIPLVGLLLIVALIPLFISAESASDARQRDLELSACSEAITNGGFEASDGWVFPITAYTAGYSSAVCNCGTWSARLGIVNSLDNRYAYSDMQQEVSLPLSASSITLYFTYYPISGEAGAIPTPYPRMAAEPAVAPSYDIQYLLLLDKDENWIDTLLWERRNDQSWLHFTTDLSAYAGQTVILQFGAYNQGTGGATAMYVDNVSLTVCQADAPTPTPITPTGTPTETPAPSVTPTATETPIATATCTVVPTVCPDILLNGSFENDTAWVLPITAYGAAYSTAEFYECSRSMRLGIVDPLDNVYAYSDARQTVSIPSGASAVTLRYYAYTLSGEPAVVPTPYPRTIAAEFLTYDVQYLLLLDSGDAWIDTLQWECRNDGAWRYYEVDLTAYSGQTVTLQFGAYNQGTGGVTAMYVDRVSLEVCHTPTLTPTPTTPTATPAATATLVPGACPDIIDNGGFEASSDWFIPATAYSAGYSTAQAYAGSRSMRLGIVDLLDNVYAYSDASQTVTIGAGTTATLAFWAYPLSDEPGMVPTPYPRTMTAEFLTYDVQYLLLLDPYDQWIDTLLWQCSDAQVWTHHTFDLSAYAGETITLQFGAYNQGTGGVTAMYIDAVSLEVCPPAPLMLPLVFRDHNPSVAIPTFTPTQTPPAGPTATPTETPVATLTPTPTATATATVEPPTPTGTAVYPSP